MNRMITHENKSHAIFIYIFELATTAKYLLLKDLFQVYSHQTICVGTECCQEYLKRDVEYRWIMPCTCTKVYGNE